MRRTIPFAAAILIAVLCLWGSVAPSAQGFANWNWNMMRGSRGVDVTELQGRLRYVNYYHGAIDGVFGWQTYWAVRNFQRDVGLRVDGIAGPATKAALVQRSRGYRPAPAQTSASPATGVGRFSARDIDLLTRVVYGEARGEPYTGQVAVAAVVLNRLEDPRFPHTIPGVIFQPGAFTAVSDGQIWLTPDSEARKAVLDAIRGWDPTGGAIYYFNPATATSRWIWSRPQIKQIGRHIFTR
ncbi:spore cortex-lytic enzyme [Kyrpidia tusciae]|uniref:Spore cortex-lytic enzyme n=1 Tax=Kyrpidia tusciae (strain DSM 2912 / NBRC 15312 / T2) TaxID=562970 RepID=D5WQL6_KYRT2|nr:spore cortex-lytic enzyme [Kyrpidia tusciae]ADG06625.1 spore cortex-lytic enzyme [Kyrpidia tusciae DSM 2912]